jgi:hypothetical protein
MLQSHKETIQRIKQEHRVQLQQGQQQHQEELSALKLTLDKLKSMQLQVSCLDVCMDLDRMLGCVDVWMCGCVDVWMCGCVDAWPSLTFSC